MLNKQNPVKRHRVVIIGSGFGGYYAAKALKHENVEVILIAKTAHFLFQPLLYQVTTGIIAAGQIAPAIRTLLARQKNANVIIGEVTKINVKNKQVISKFLDKETITDFDSLIVAAGANQSYFGKNEFEKFAPGMKTIDDALELRGRILNVFEQAELAASPEEKKQLLTFVIIGAGPTGVELAGQVAEMSRSTLVDNYRHIDPASANIVLLDAAEKVLPPFPDKLGDAAAKRLKKLGVDIRLNSMVVDLDGDSVTVKKHDGTLERIESKCKIWSAGVEASALGKDLSEQTGVQLDRSGRVIVNPDLSVANYPNIFVIGDMMSIPGVPGLSQAAMQGGRYAAAAIIAGLAGQDPKQRKPFKYFDKGSMAIVSKFNAVVNMRKLKFNGFFAWLLWLGVHLWYTKGTYNKIVTLLSWFSGIFSKKRHHLNVTEQQIYGREAIHELCKIALSNKIDVKDLPPVVRNSVK